VITRAEQNTWELIGEDRARLERVGIFGNLTVGFLSGSLVAWLGLLIYTFASLTGRLRSFAILRALGLDIKQVLAIVSIEYLLVILYGIIGGAIAGIATSQLFVPFFQFTEDPTVQVPPFLPEIAAEQLAWIILVYVSVLIIAEAVVLVRATRREAFQTLRLGDEE
jgi:putative ABC transport system permease protein